MHPIVSIGKYLDQPYINAKFSQAVPGVLIGGASAFGLYDTFSQTEEKKSKRFIKNLAVLTGTVASALIATRGWKRFNISGLSDSPSVKNVKEGLGELISLAKGKIAKLDLQETISEKGVKKLLDKDIFKGNDELSGLITKAAKEELDIKDSNRFIELLESVKKPEAEELIEELFPSKDILTILGDKNKSKILKEICEDSELKTFLEKIPEGPLSLSKVKEFHKLLQKHNKGENKVGDEFFNAIIPAPEAVDSKEIWSELGRLSLLGAIPVAGGIAGGTVGDALTEKKWKKRIPNKIKEGFYQYAANIVLCNVGAGAALATLEGLKKANPALKVGPWTRGLSMFGGILATGVIGGSAIANFLAKKFVNPLLGNQKSDNINLKNLYEERHPEAIDVGLHVDDIATVGVLSGFSWIEPSLPLLYSISGYRAGIGYRNGKASKSNKAQNRHAHRQHNHHKAGKGLNPYCELRKADLENNSTFLAFSSLNNK